MCCDPYVSVSPTSHRAVEIAEICFSLKYREKKRHLERRIMADFGLNPVSPQATRRLPRSSQPRWSLVNTKQLCSLTSYAGTRHSIHQRLNGGQRPDVRSFIKPRWQAFRVRVSKLHCTDLCVSGFVNRTFKNNKRRPKCFVIETPEWEEIEEEKNTWRGDFEWIRIYKICSTTWVF